MTRAVMDARVQLAIQYIIQSYDARAFFELIKQNLAAKTHAEERVRAMYREDLDWNCSLAGVFTVWARAREVMKSELVIDMKAEVVKHMASLNLIERLALQQKNLSQARLVAKDRERFLRLDALLADDGTPDDEGASFKLDDGTTLTI